MFCLSSVGSQLRWTLYSSNQLWRDPTQRVAYSIEMHLECIKADWDKHQNGTTVLYVVSEKKTNQKLNPRAISKL